MQQGFSVKRRQLCQAQEEYWSKLLKTDRDASNKILQQSLGFRLFLVQSWRCWKMLENVCETTLMSSKSKRVCFIGWNCELFGRLSEDSGWFLYLHWSLKGVERGNGHQSQTNMPAHRGGKETAGLKLPILLVSAFTFFKACFQVYRPLALEAGMTLATELLQCLTQHASCRCDKHAQDFFGYLETIFFFSGWPF